MKNLAKASITIAVILLSGCKAEHDVDWYKSHDKERLAKVEQCQKQSDVNQDADCRNALDAQSDIINFGKDDGDNRPASIHGPSKK